MSPEPTQDFPPCPPLPPEQWGTGRAPTFEELREAMYAPPVYDGSPLPEPTLWPECQHGHRWEDSAPRGILIGMVLGAVMWAVVMLGVIIWVMRK